MHSQLTQLMSIASQLRVAQLMEPIQDTLARLGEKIDAISGVKGFQLDKMLKVSLIPFFLYVHFNY
jgi:hypothetical protein